jgi:hypothetical protein
MGVFNLAKLFGMTIRESANDGSDFTNPDADYRRLFLGEDGQLHVKDSSGTVTDIGGAVSDIVDLPTAETDSTLVLAPDGAGGVEFRAETGGGGGTIVYPALKPGTPTDDFDAALSGWTAASTAGSFSLAECFAQAIDGSHLWIAAYGKNGFIYQSASDVDQEWIVGGLHVDGRWSDAFIGIALLDTSNNGVGLIYHQSDNTCAIIAIASGVYTGSPAAHTTSTAWGNGMGWGTRFWFRLVRSGNVFTAYASVDGVNWNESTATITSSFTVARKAIGSFGIDASGKIFQMVADWVDTV